MLCVLVSLGSRVSFVVVDLAALCKCASHGDKGSLASVMAAGPSHYAGRDPNFYDFQLIAPGTVV